MSPDHPPDLGIEHSICSGDAKGTNSVIGLASAKRFVKEGAQVYITGAARRNWTELSRRSGPA